MSNRLGDLLVLPVDELHPVMAIAFLVPYFKPFWINLEGR